MKITEILATLLLILALVATFTLLGRQFDAWVDGKIDGSKMPDNCELLSRNGDYWYECKFN